MKKLLIIALCSFSFGIINAQTIKADDLVGNWKMYFPGGPNGEFNDTLDVEYEFMDNGSYVMYENGEEKTGTFSVGIGHITFDKSEEEVYKITVKGKNEYFFMPVGQRGAGHVLYRLD